MSYSADIQGTDNIHFQTFKYFIIHVHLGTKIERTTKRCEERRNCVEIGKTIIWTEGCK